MHNIATKFAKRRPDYSGGFYDLTPEEIEAVPDRIAIVNMALALLGVVLLVISLLLGSPIPSWGKWFLFLASYFLLFILWSHVPTQRLDQHIPWMNSFGRPFLDTLVLTGAPAVFAKLLHVPFEWLLIPITFLREALIKSPVRPELVEG